MKKGDTIWVVRGVYPTEAIFIKMDRYNKKEIICERKGYEYPVLKVNVFTNIYDAMKRVEENLLELLEETQMRLKAMES